MVAVSQLVSASDVESRADFDQLTRRLKAGHIQKPYLTQNSMDVFFQVCMLVEAPETQNNTPNPRKSVFFIIWAL